MSSSPSPNMTGRVIIVTGANSGLGFEVTKYLAEGGNDVIMACRSTEKGERAAERIRDIHPNCLLTVMKLDLAYSKSVREFVEEFGKKKKKLNVLVNNAGMCLNFDDATLRNTRERNEVTMATNHLGPFLLTNLLLDYLITTSSIMGDGRVVNVTCGLHNTDSEWHSRDLDALDLGNFQLQEEGTFNGFQAYKNSKVCNILFTYRLAENLKSTDVTCNAVDPGIVASTQLYRHAGRMGRTVLCCCAPRYLCCARWTRSARKAAAEIADLATSEKFQGLTGRYMSRGVAARSSEESYDVTLQERVWKLSAKLTNFKSANDESFDEISLGRD